MISSNSANREHTFAIQCCSSPLEMGLSPPFPLQNVLELNGSMALNRGLERFGLGSDPPTVMLAKVNLR